MPLSLPVVEAETINDLDFEYTPPCEGSTHSQGRNGHAAEEPASWILCMPCCGPRVLVCESRRIYIRTNGDILCNGCDTWRDTHTLVFLPVNDAP